MTDTQRQTDSQESELSVITTPRIYLAGTRRTPALSRIALGLAAEFKRREVGIAAAKVGPSLVEPTHFRRVSGRLSHTLDPWMLTPQQIVESFARLSSGAELIIIEGEQGLFDVREGDHAAPRDADVAALLQAPVVLVVDAQECRESVGASVRGFAHWDSRTEVLGVIAANVEDEAHNSAIRSAVERVGGTKYLGGVPPGTIEANAGGGDNPSLLTRSYVVEIRETISRTVDIDALCVIARAARQLSVPHIVVDSMQRRCRIAVADDAGYHLAVQDNLDLVRRFGAELSAFSPLADIKLPQGVWGIYIPSGYTYLYGAEAARNSRMAAALRAFVDKGGVLYAEGAAVPYLCREFTIGGDMTSKGIGLLPAEASLFTSSPSAADHRYYTVTIDAQTPLGQPESEYRAVSHRRWLIRPDAQMKCWSVAQGRTFAAAEGDTGSAMLLQGFWPLPNIILSQVMGHWGSNPAVASAFVASVAAAQERAKTTGVV